MSFLDGGLASTLRGASAVLVLGGVAGAQELYRTHDGSAGGDWFGSSVAGAGDVNADGFADYIIGAREFGIDSSGYAKVYSGLDGAELHEFAAPASSHGIGRSVAAAGDVNRDGHTDLILGADLEDYADVYCGQTGALLHHLTGASTDRFGFAVSGAGDLNQDGYDDVLVGSIWESNTAPFAGSVRAYSGKDGELLHVFDGEGSSDLFGGSIASAGDVDGDGVPDIVAGSIYDYVRVFSGATGALLHGFAAEVPGDEFGECVAGAGDVDADGRDDVIVGAREEGFAGAAYVFSGRDGRLLHVFRGDDSGELFGDCVRGVGDLDCDGHDDVLVTAPLDDAFGNNTGYVRFFSGRTGEELATIHGLVVDGILGNEAALVGDADGDGLSEVIVGSFRESSNGFESGSARVFSWTGRTCRLYGELHR